MKSYCMKKILSNSYCFFLAFFIALFCVIPIDETIASNNSYGITLPRILGVIPAYNM